MNIFVLIFKIKNLIPNEQILSFFQMTQTINFHKSSHKSFSDARSNNYLI
jgi:hypothetical protein